MWPKVKRKSQHASFFFNLMNGSRGSVRYGPIWSFPKRDGKKSVSISDQNSAKKRVDFVDWDTDRLSYVTSRKFQNSWKILDPQIIQVLIDILLYTVHFNRRERI